MIEVANLDMLKDCDRTKSHFARQIEIDRELTRVLSICSVAVLIQFGVVVNLAPAPPSLKVLVSAV